MDEKKKIDETKRVARRSDKYHQDEIKNIKAKASKKTESKTNNPIPVIKENENKKASEEKNNHNIKLNPKELKNIKDKVITHEHAPTQNNKSRTNSFNNNNKIGDNMAKRKRRKTSRIDKNSLIFFGILFFVILIFLLKTMGAFMALITMIGIFLIIGFSNLLKRIRKNKIVRIITNILLVLILLGCIAGVCAVGYFGYIIVTEAPEWDPKVLNTKETSILYDANGTEYAELGTEKRELISYSDSSENLINAIIAVEDSRFFTHNGFDPLRFFKAGVGQVLGNSDAGGASTLSMQVVKNSFTDKYGQFTQMNSSGIKRKFTDIYLAVFKLEKEYSKEAIFEYYINNHFLGNNSYGVEQAAETYFGKKASQLTLSEAALIAGMFQAPSSYDPFANPEAATERRATVLKLMYDHGYISKEERESANAIPVTSLLVSKKNDKNLQYQSYIDTVIDELIYKHGVNPYNTSLKVYTNIDLKKQAGLDKIFAGETFNWENDKVQSGIAAVDVHSGKIVAIAGGRNTGAREFNRAASKDFKKQIGSTAKPVFDYAPAMEYNNWSTYTLIKDEKYYYSSGQEIRNSDRKYQGTITLRKALAESRNVPALKAFQAVDNNDIYDFVTGLGITPETTKNSKYLHEAHSIGAFNGSNPLEMAAAYAAFANGGIYYEPYSVNKIVYRDTGETYVYETESHRAMSEATAFMITYSLKYAVTDGMSSGVKMKGINLAAKTGTTNFTSADAKRFNLPDIAVNDAWIVGYDPDTAVGMWYGYDEIIKHDKSKSKCAADAYYLKSAPSGCKRNVLTERNGLYLAAGKVLFTSNGKDFKVPKSVVKVAVEMGTEPAKLASAATPKNKITYEYFKKGTEPTEVSTAYNKLANVTGLTATYYPVTRDVTLNWNAVATPNDIEDSYGEFGYKVYKNGTYVDFTTDTHYTISGMPDPTGTYKVVTTFKNYSDRDSSGASAKIGDEDTDASIYTGDVTFQTNIAVGSELNSCLVSGTVDNSCVILYKDGVAVSDGYTTTVTITDSAGDTIAIDTAAPNNYNATFKIKYNGKVRVTKVVAITVK